MPGVMPGVLFTQRQQQQETKTLYMSYCTSCSPYFLASTFTTRLSSPLRSSPLHLSSISPPFTLLSTTSYPPLYYILPSFLLSLTLLLSTTSYPPLYYSYIHSLSLYFLVPLLSVTFTYYLYFLITCYFFFPYYLLPFLPYYLLPFLPYYLLSFPSLLPVILSFLITCDISFLLPVTFPSLLPVTFPSLLPVTFPSLLPVTLSFPITCYLFLPYYL